MDVLRVSYMAPPLAADALAAAAAVDGGEEAEPAAAEDVVLVVAHVCDSEASPSCVFAPLDSD